MSYVPEVNDYVKWKEQIEGWVYFKDNQYITIEVGIRPKSEYDYQNSSIHRNHRVLILCYNNQWNELEYIRSRDSVNDE
jgi:hypothetical protein